MIDLDARMLNEIPTPGYAVDENAIIKNLDALEYIQQRTGCKILLAQKAFSMFALYPLIGKYLYGAAASGLFEAKLAREHMGGETHIYSPAYIDSEFDEIAKVCDCIIFNSFEQLKKYKSRASDRQIGLRVNPEYSEIDNDMYNPCAPNSRFGVNLSDIAKNKTQMKSVDGLHFHTMCEQDSDVLWRTLQIFDDEFGKYLIADHIKWVNFGGGQLITREGYDAETLIESIMFIKNKYNVDVYLEPGEAVALGAGVLAASVLDIVDNGELPVAILDASAACHMPDVLEVPYTPEVSGAGRPGEKKYDYRLAGNTCLAGDIIGDYSFDHILREGDKIVFGDMAHYTMVKNNTFNGMKLPSIVLLTKDGEVKIIKEFGYADFKNRLS